MANKKNKDNTKLSQQDLELINSKIGMKILFRNDKLDVNDVVEQARYESSLRELQVELVKLQKTYAKKFQKILTPQKTIKYLQAENKIKALIDAEILLFVMVISIC